MSDEEADKVRAAIDEEQQMAEEVEASGEASFEGADVENARQAMHQWVDTVVAVVATPAFGRVTLVHKNGRKSSISSVDLPLLVSRPVNWDKRD